MQFFSPRFMGSFSPDPRAIRPYVFHTSRDLICRFLEHRTTSLNTTSPTHLMNRRRATSTVLARTSLSGIVNQSLPKSSERPVMLSSFNGTIVSRVSKRAFPFRYHQPGQTGNRMSSNDRPIPLYLLFMTEHRVPRLISQSRLC